jgi:hypothetical protein
MYQRRLNAYEADRVPPSCDSMPYVANAPESFRGSSMNESTSPSGKNTVRRFAAALGTEPDVLNPPMLNPNRNFFSTSSAWLLVVAARITQTAALDPRIAFSLLTVRDPPPARLLMCVPQIPSK